MRVTEFRTDLVTGRLLAAVFCGLELQALLAEPLPVREDIEAIFRQAIPGRSMNSVTAGRADAR
jgi:hypothetical protein